MKEIYVISLDDDVPLPSTTYSDIRQVAYLLYDELDRYDKHILCIDDDDTLIRNDLYEIYSTISNTYTYRFDSDKSNINYKKYEPFIINDRSFGFTVYENSVTKEEIYLMLNRAISFLKINSNYKFNISSIKYSNPDDRFKAIDSLIKKDYKNDRSKVLKKQIKPIFSVFGLR